MRSRAWMVFFKNSIFLVAYSVAGGAVGDSELKTSYTFSGNRWTDNAGHRVATSVFPGRTSGEIRANVIVRYDLGQGPNWSVNFFVKIDDLLVFDRGVYKVVEIVLDEIRRARIEETSKKRRSILPGSTDFRDMVLVRRVNGKNFLNGQIVLPKYPSTLNFFVNESDRVEVIFDGVEKDVRKGEIVRLRWAIRPAYGIVEQSPSDHSHYSKIIAPIGEIIEIPLVGKIRIDEIIDEEINHVTWLALSRRP